MTSTSRCSSSIILKSSRNASFNSISSLNSNSTKSFKLAPTLSLSPTNLNSTNRTFSTSNAISAKPRRARNANDPLALDKMPAFEYDDIPSTGHSILRDRANILKYYRLAEFELPKLKGERLTDTRSG